MNAVRAGAESGSVSVRSHEVPEMLSNEEFLLWCRRLGLSQEGQEIVTKIRTSGPARRPGVVGVCGHSDNGKAAGTYQSFAQGLARLGYVVLIIDPAGP